jgi:hypothetical protein
MNQSLVAYEVDGRGRSLTGWWTVVLGGGLDVDIDGFRLGFDRNSTCHQQ